VRTFIVTASQTITNDDYAATPQGGLPVIGDIAVSTYVNHAPAADAGAPQTVHTGLVALDGSGSSDPDSDALSYQWQQTGGPATVTLNDADTMMTTFTAPPITGTYTFSLAITDTYGLTDSNTTTITITLPDLTITKSGPSEVEPGEPITYTLVAANNGTAAATSLVITDALPSGATFVTASDGGSLMGNTVSWSVPSLDAGGEVTLTLTITAPETVTNDDYRVSCAEGISAIGSTSVTTEVTKKVYLPLVTRNY
jgi:chitinase